MDKLIHLLRKEVGNLKVEWHKNLDVFQILIGTVLSQRTKDQNTAKAADALFSKYKTPRAIADAPLKKIEMLIKPSGFYRVKAKRIKEISRLIVEKYKGKVPKSLDSLVSLPGVGRKTANCVLCFGFGIAAIPVDVHVHRISNRVGIVKTKTPEETEIELMKVFPKKYWIEINELMVLFGQNVCLPIRPKCQKCSLNKVCEFVKNR